MDMRNPDTQAETASEPPEGAPSKPRAAASSPVRHHRQRCDRGRCVVVDLVPGAARAAAGAGRGRRDAPRHRGAGRWARRRNPGRTRPERRSGRGAREDRQPGNDCQERAGAGGEESSRKRNLPTSVSARARRSLPRARPRLERAQVERGVWRRRPTIASISWQQAATLRRRGSTR